MDKEIIKIYVLSTLDNVIKMLIHRPLSTRPYAPTTHPNFSNWSKKKGERE
jgi:hypothetical protein